MNPQVAKDAFELWFEAHQYTIAAVGVFFTVAAVLLSLYLAIVAHYQSKPRIRAVVNTSKIYHRTIQQGQEPSFVTVDILNTGNVDVHIPFSFFRIGAPGIKIEGLVNPMDAYGGHEWVPQVTYPVTILPRKSHAFFIGPPEGFKDVLAAGFREDTWRHWYCRTFMRIRIRTSDGYWVRAKLGKEVKAMIKVARALSTADREAAFQRNRDRNARYLAGENGL